MASGAKYFILNREDDWKYKSIIRDVIFEEDMLLSNNKSGENSVYISSSFDTLQNETIWHRMRLNYNLPNDALLRLRLYTSDSKKVLIPALNGKGLMQSDIDDYILNDNIDINRKIDIFDYIGAKKYENPTDILMYNLRGRYLWICMELINYSHDQIKVKDVKIEFPKVTFTDYLPEIYKEHDGKDSFLERFLGIFQSMYVDLEDRIDNTPINFDPEMTSKDFLVWISRWLSIKDAFIWGEDRLKILLKQVTNIYKSKGTKQSISRIVEEFVGVEPIVVEQFDLKNNQHYEIQKSHIEGLFGDNGYVFTVILNEKYVKSPEDYIEILRVINTVKPIDSICNLVVLNDKIYLDHHCYIGINSYIAKNYEFVIDAKKKDSNTLMLVDVNPKVKQTKK